MDRPCLKSRPGYAAHCGVPVARRDRIVVSTLRCGRSNLGSNPSHGIILWSLFCSTLSLMNSSLQIYPLPLIVTQEAWEVLALSQAVLQEMGMNL